VSLYEKISAWETILKNVFLNFGESEIEINGAVMQKIIIFLSNLYVVLHDMNFLLFVHLYFIILMC